jgi:hypothetical protein
MISQAPVAHACNPSYSGGRDQEDCSLKPTWANGSRDPILKKTLHKNRAGGVAQDVSPEFKPQKQKTKKVHDSRHFSIALTFDMSQTICRSYLLNDKSRHCDVKTFPILLILICCLNLVSPIYLRRHHSLGSNSTWVYLRRGNCPGLKELSKNKMYLLLTCTLLALVQPLTLPRISPSSRC